MFYTVQRFLERDLKIQKLIKINKKIFKKNKRGGGRLFEMLEYGVFVILILIPPALPYTYWISQLE